MPMETFSLPPKIFENNLPRLLSELARHDLSGEALVLDMGKVEYWIPAAIVATCAAVNRWMEAGRQILFANHQNCRACGYLQRVDFFDQVGLKLSENFTRHDPGTSFVEIQVVEPDVARLTDPVARKLAECLAGTKSPSDDVLRFSEYALGEIIANCQQHAEKPGYVTAQYVQNRDWARIGIADYGIGILESFRKTASPHYREGMSDAEMLEVAMRPWVSSKRHLPPGPYGERPNRGVGLKMILNMLQQSHGELFIASGNAWRHYVSGRPVVSGVFPSERSIAGTVVSIRYDRGQIAAYQQILADAQKAMNLLPEEDDDRFFS